MDRLWICTSCDGACFRSYDAVAANGEPLCPFCGNYMRLTKAMGRDFDTIAPIVRL